MYIYKRIMILLISNLCFQVSFAQEDESQSVKCVEKAMITAVNSDIEPVEVSSDTIRVKKIVKEVRVNYRAEDKNWIYDSDSWMYKNRKVDSLPPSYEKQTITKMHISEFNKEENGYTSNVEKEEVIEYYKIADGWIWDDNLMKWVNESEAINIHPKYKLLKTISFK